MDLNVIKQYTKNLTILHVDDDRTLLQNIGKILENFFKKVTLCKDGKDGLEEYKKDRFDIVLTDLYMPNMSGIEMVERILEINHEQHICVFSSQDDTLMLRKLINLNINSFLLKPFKKKQLLYTIGKVAKNICSEKILAEYHDRLEKTNEELEKELIESYKHNNLTNIKNRFALSEDIEKHNFTMLAILDIDHLDFINNLYGSDIGNIVIKKFSEILVNEIKKSNFYLYQLSGEEFAIYSNDEDMKNFKKFISNLSKKVTNLPIYIDSIDEEIYIDVTIGVIYELNEMASFGMMFESHLLLAQANSALKYAKRKDLNIVSYDESINELQDIQNILEWKQKIKEAIEDDKIVPVFQPIVDKDANIIKYETLMRLEVGGELISPYYFLDIAIQTKQYFKLSYIIIYQALEKLKNFDVRLSINIIYRDLFDESIKTLIFDRLKEGDIGKRLVIEIVESEDIKDQEILMEFIKDVKKYGVKIAIDDFGSGFSNFENVIKFDVDYIKIDGSLIKNIDKDKSSLAIVKAIVQFAHTLDKKLIAEYVHSKEVLEVLKNIGINEYQGFYFYEPQREFIKESIISL